MTTPTTAEVIKRFNHAFVEHDGNLLAGLIDESCVMEAIEPAPAGAVLEGRPACLAFWQALCDDLDTQFTPEEVIVARDHATILWTYRFGPAATDYVRGVNVMSVADGRIVRALGYSKTPASGSPRLADLIETADR